MVTKSMIKKCPYCMTDTEVSGISVREIPGYVNSMGKNTAIVEKLACGHEFIDGKFNIDNIYFHTPICPNPVTIKEYVKKVNKVSDIHRNTIPIEDSYLYIPKRNGINAMDVACMVCLIFLAVTYPPLVILPALYFVGRLK